MGNHPQLYVPHTCTSLAETQRLIAKVLAFASFELATGMQLLWKGLVLVVVVVVVVIVVYIQCCKNNEYSFGCLTGSIILQGMVEKWGEVVILSSQLQFLESYKPMSKGKPCSIM